MARTYRRADRGGDGSNVWALRLYNKLVRRTKEIPSGSKYKKLVPWFYEDLRYHYWYQGDFKMKEGDGDWKWDEVGLEDAQDHEVSHYRGKKYLHAPKKRNPNSKADDRMIRRRQARREKAREKDYFDE